MPASVARSRGETAKEIAAAAATANPSRPTGSTTAASRGGNVAPAITRRSQPACCLPAPRDLPAPVPDRHGDDRQSHENSEKPAVLPLQHFLALPRRRFRPAG